MRRADLKFNVAAILKGRQPDCSWQAHGPLVTSLPDGFGAIASVRLSALTSSQKCMVPFFLDIVISSRDDGIWCRHDTGLNSCPFPEEKRERAEELLRTRPTDAIFWIFDIGSEFLSASERLALCQLTVRARPVVESLAASTS